MLVFYVCLWLPEFPEFFLHFPFVCSQVLLLLVVGGRALAIVVVAFVCFELWGV